MSNKANQELDKKKITRLYRRKNSRVKKELSFTTPKSIKTV